MNDFDFEELDKAVSALGTKTEKELGGPLPGPASRPALSPRPATVPERSMQPSPTPDEAPSLSTAEPAASSEATLPVKRRLSNTQPKPRGAFMDIVPPQPSRKPPTRVGVSIQPLRKPEDIIADSPAPDRPVVEPPTTAQLSDELPQSPRSMKADRSTPPHESEGPEPARPQLSPEPEPTEEANWPDPLDFRMDSSAESSSQKQPESTEPASPFLAEAKVEKRPLGAFSHFKSVEAADTTTADTEPPVATSEKADRPTPDKAPLPPKRAEPEVTDEPAKPDLHGAAMMSIPPQYRTEDKPADKATRSVFDTKEYHPPLIEATSHEHRGGGGMWGKIFIAFVVLALLAVAGYFAYLYFVQQ